MLYCHSIFGINMKMLGCHKNLFEGQRYEFENHILILFVRYSVKPEGHMKVITCYYYMRP